MISLQTADSNSSTESSGGDDEKQQLDRQLDPKHSEGEGSVYPRLKFKGIRQRTWGQWVSEIREPRKRSKIWLGSFPTPEMAARAYDAALLCLRGPHAAFNFPDSPALIHPGVCTSKKDIQAIAAAAAAAAAPDTTSTQPSTSTPSPIPADNSDQTPPQIHEDDDVYSRSNEYPGTGSAYFDHHISQSVDWVSTAVRMEEEETASLMTLPDMAKGMLLDPLPPLQLLYNERSQNFDQSEAFANDGGGTINPHEDLPFWS